MIGPEMIHSTYDNLHVYVFTLYTMYINISFVKIIDALYLMI